MKIYPGLGILVCFPAKKEDILTTNMCFIVTSVKKLKWTEFRREEPTQATISWGLKRCKQLGFWGVFDNKVRSIFFYFWEPIVLKYHQFNSVHCIIISQGQFYSHSNEALGNLCHLWVLLTNFPSRWTQTHNPLFH